MITTFQFAQPWAFLLLLLIPLMVHSQLRSARRRLPSVGFSDLSLVRWSKACQPRYEGHIPLTLLALAFALGTVALARPQILEHRRSEIKQAGIDIMLALDTSSSMQAMDLLPSRMEAAVAVSKKFVEGRPNDRIGLVVFAGEAVTQCPPTTDHSALMTYLDSVRIGVTGTDGTAIGDGIATCLNRLKKAEGKSKIVVLLTDGRNNQGVLDPLAAAKLAKSVGVKVYTIGAAKRGAAPMQITDPYGMKRQVMVDVDLDEDLLTKIAEETGAKYWRATDTESLINIFSEINKMEKTEKPAEESVEHRELFIFLLFPAIVLLFSSIWFNTLVWGEVP